MRRLFQTLDNTLDRFGLRRGKKAKHTRQHKGRSLQIEPLEQRQLLSVAPTIGSLSLSRDWAHVGDILTLTANDVSDQDGSIKDVSFYCLNGNSQTLIGTDSNGTDGWSMNFNTTSRQTGNYTFMAVASDETNLLSNIASKEMTVIAGNETAIENLTDLQGITNMSGAYGLVADIDASDTADSNWGDGQGFVPTGTDGHEFSGTFDGYGHIITGLTIDRPTANCIGLFGATNSGASISNLGLEDVQIDGQYLVAGLVGRNWGTITNCSVSGTVIGHTGDSVSNGDRNGGIGGLVGLNMRSISDSFSTATVSTVGVSGANYGNGGGIGGLAGGMTVYGGYPASITNCYTTGNVSGGYYVGGLVGGMSGNSSIDNCYATGNVTANIWLGGGLVGICYDAETISDSFATGDVSGPYDNGAFVGGLWLTSATLTNNYCNPAATIENPTPSPRDYYVYAVTATPTTISELGQVTHAVYQGSGSTPTPWTFTGDNPAWVMGNLPQLRENNDRPYLSISGDQSVAEGSPYTLHLSAIGDGADTITSWRINWGDGQIQTVTGNPPAVTHYYADGDADYSISATATDGNRTFNNTGFWIPPSAQAGRRSRISMVLIGLRPWQSSRMAR